MFSFNKTLMYVTDDRIDDNELFFIILEASLKGGANIIQLREKNRDTLSFYNRAVIAKKMCEKYNVPLIINDRLDIALAVNADGIHIGQTDLPYAIARKILGKNKIIGLSVSDENEVIDANSLNVDYIGVSPIFSTNTKTKNLAPPLGVEGLKKLKTVSNKPMVCIGGINVNNAKSLIDNQAEGIAVVSAISKAQTPEVATKQLKNIVCKIGLTT